MAYISNSFDESGKIIGSGYTEAYDANSVINAPTSLNNPPLANYIQRDYDIIAHWYDDYGRRGSSSFPWSTWNWNWFSNNGNGNGFDIQRQPYLNWYQGDDPKVLGWICYWLAKYGVKAVSISSEDIDTSTWATVTNKYHNYYNLFVNTPNFAALKYILWLQCVWTAGTELSVIVAQWQKNLSQIVLNYPSQVYTITWKGKVYPVFFMFNFSSLLGAHSGGAGITGGDISFYLQQVAATAKASGHGWNGICVIAHNSLSDTQMWGTGSGYQHLEDNGVIFLRGSYTGFAFSDRDQAGAYYDLTQTTYGPMTTTGFPMSTPANLERRVFSVPTAAKTMAPHPSTFTWSGTTPAKFSTALALVKAYITAHSTLSTKMMTIYNVSEWAEAGPGLIPNMQDGIGYLQAVDTNFPALPPPGTPTPPCSMKMYSNGAGAYRSFP